jgi:hypothetical protein
MSDAYHLAQLRHAYAHLVAGRVTNQKEFADGLIAPAIRHLESSGTPSQSAQFRVWWVPQVPMQSFLYEVPDIATGKALCDALAKYDMFQLEHNVKPDYCNAGGMAWKHPVHTDGEWHDFDYEDEFEVEDIHTAIAKAGGE